MSEIIISNGVISASISTLGAELTSLKYNNKEYIWEGNPTFWKSHCPVLFPVCGGIKDDEYTYKNVNYPLQKHGFVRFEEFEVYSKETDSVTFLLKESEKTLAMFPFKFNLFITFKLKGKSMIVDYKVENKDDKEMYYSIGSHEGYSLKSDIKDYSILFEKDEVLHSYNLEGNFLRHDYLNISDKSNILPLKYDYFKIDALAFPHVNSKKVWLLQNNKKVLSVEFPNCSNIFIWTKVGAPYICIEPWTAVPDFVDGVKDIAKKPDITKLDPLKERTYTHIINIEE